MLHLCRNCVLIVDCEWSDWGPWSPCSKSCGEPFEGLITKYRHIATKAQHGGIECKGKNFESEPCPHESCKVNKCDHGYENRSCKKDTCDSTYGKPMSSNQWITHCPGNESFNIIIIKLY